MQIARKDLSMTPDKELSSCVNQVLELLLLHINSAEEADGWSLESRRAVVNYFAEVKQKLETDEPLPPLDIVRGLDHWGVTGGDLLENIARVANALRNR